MTLTRPELDLLCSYAAGPRIWDAVALQPGVFGLQGKGLIEPAPPAEDGSPPSRGAYQLTAEGRQVLARHEQEITT